jgi:hypothetical protein
MGFSSLYIVTFAVSQSFKQYERFGSLLPVAWQQSEPSGAHEVLFQVIVCSDCLMVYAMIFVLLQVRAATMLDASQIRISDP